MASPSKSRSHVFIWRFLIWRGFFVCKLNVKIAKLKHARNIPDLHSLYHRTFSSHLIIVNVEQEAAWHGE